MFGGGGGDGVVVVDGDGDVVYILDYTFIQFIQTHTHVRTHI